MGNFRNFVLRVQLTKMNVNDIKVLDLVQADELIFLLHWTIMWQQLDKVYQRYLLLNSFFL